MDFKGLWHTFNHNSDFKKFWFGQTVSNPGSSLSLFVFPLLIFELTHSAMNLALSTAVTYLPYLLFGLFIGACVDRLNRKKLMIIADLARIICLGSIPVLFSLHLLSLVDLCSHLCELYLHNHL
ncbi:transmembrane secretion effector [Thermosporothrix hazakensis]|jgi:MFS family permease|uniref:Transmembrane secretion effector n=1 Tax=Thermosporothrix hazakensis TaxID=644383 RepID=A0A326U3W6_THEHA|nr:MFS transporter [Thermosporothrix hazakensis]PZW18324.1 transmembrane secretion effector [Thermosporothrix hazakensis]